MSAKTPKCSNSGFSDQSQCAITGGHARHAVLPVCGPRRRGATLVLVLIAVAIAATLALTFASAQSTSIGIAANVQDYTKARHVAESGLEVALKYVRANSDWRTTKSNGTWVTNYPFGPGTFTIRGEDGVDTNGDGTPDGDGDLADDPNDLLTLTVTGRVGGTAHIARLVLTPTPTHTPLLIYGLASDNQLRYRRWTGSAWGSALTGTDVGGGPRWIVAASSPTASEILAGVLDATEDANIQFFNGLSWSGASELTAATVQVSERAFDAAYEQVSGDVLMAYRSSGGNALRYRTRTGSGLSSESSFTLPATGGLRWIRLVPKPGSNEIVLVTLDANRDVCAAIWDGSTWTSAILLENNAKAAGDEGVAAAYESQSGEAVVLWSAEGVNAFQYRTWSGTVWSSEADGPTLGSGEPRWLRLVPDPASNTVLAGSLDGNRDIYLITWNGSAWTSATLIETSTPDSNSREFDIAFEHGGTKAVAAWGRSGLNNFVYRTWNGSTWSAEQLGPGMASRVKIAQLVTGPAAGQVLINALDTSSSGTLGAFLWNSTSVASLGTIATGIAGSNVQECFAATVPPPLEEEATVQTYAIEWRE